MCFHTALHMLHLCTCSHGVQDESFVNGDISAILLFYYNMISTHGMLHVATLANQCCSCRPQFSPSHPSSKPPTHPPLSEVLLKLLSIPMTPPGMVQRALECYNVMAAITPALHRSAFAGIFTSGMTKLSITAARTLLARQPERP